MKSACVGVLSIIEQTDCFSVVMEPVQAVEVA